MFDKETLFVGTVAVTIIFLLYLYVFTGAFLEAQKVLNLAIRRSTLSTKPASVYFSVSLPVLSSTWPSLISYRR
jgi:hypothetical protein